MFISFRFFFHFPLVLKARYSSPKIPHELTLIHINLTCIHCSDVTLANQEFNRKIVHSSGHYERPSLWVSLARACSLPFQKKRDLKARNEAPAGSQVWTDLFRKMM